MTAPVLQDDSLPHQIRIGFGYVPQFPGRQVTVVRCNCGWFGGHDDIHGLKRRYKEHLASLGIESS
jgi:hypothetical protein